MKKEEIKTIARNKKASHEYFILETYEAGIVLFGTEIKSVRNTKVSIQDAYCEIRNQEMFVQNMHIAQPYPCSLLFIIAILSYDHAVAHLPVGGGAVKVVAVFVARHARVVEDGVVVVHEIEKVASRFAIGVASHDVDGTAVL